MFGRIYGSVLQVQLVIDLFVLVFFLLLKLWPRGGAVALASFRESVRQPMYWLIFALTSIDLVGMGRYMRRVGPAAPRVVRRPGPPRPGSAPARSRWRRSR